MKKIKKPAFKENFTNHNQLIFLGVKIGWIDNDRKELILNGVSYSNFHILKVFAELHSVDSVFFLKIDGDNIKTSRFFPRLSLNDFQLPFVIKYKKWQISISDLWFATDYLLKINLKSIMPYDDVVIIKYYQYDFTQGVLVKVAEDNVTNTGFYISDVPLLNPLLPFLIVMMDSDGQFLTSSFLPFPSLFRGGMHYSEVYALTEGELHIDNIFSYSISLLLSFLPKRLVLSDFLVSQLSIIGEIAGDEKIFNPYLKEWLLNIFKVELLPTKLSAFMEDFYEINVGNNVENIRRMGGVLPLTSCSIPTIAVLVEKRRVTPSSVIVGSYVVANFVNHMPKASVTMPIGSKHSLFKGAEEHKKNPKYHVNFPVAIHFYRKKSYSSVSKIYAFAPDRKEISSKIFSIDIVVTLSFDDDLNSFEIILHALNTQSNVKINKVIVAVKRESEIPPKKIELLLKKKSLGGNIFCVPKRIGFMKDMLSCCMQYTEKELVLCIKDTVLLHDQHTLKNLCEIASSGDHIATVSCQIVAEVKNNVFKPIYGGYLGKGIEGATIYSNSQLGCELFEKTTYPVIANNFDCTIIKKTALQYFNYISPNVNVPIPLDNTAYLDFGLKMIEAGYHHFCTGKVIAINTSNKIKDPNVKLNISTGRLMATMGHLILVNSFKS